MLSEERIDLMTCVTCERHCATKLPQKIKTTHKAHNERTTNNDQFIYVVFELLKWNHLNWNLSPFLVSWPILYLVMVIWRAQDQEIMLRMQMGCGGVVMTRIHKRRGKLISHRVHFIYCNYRFVHFHPFDAYSLISVFHFKNMYIVALIAWI